MAFLTSFLPILIWLSISSSFASSQTRKCKPLPGGAHWPSHAEWQALNSSVNGRLIQPVPVGAVCHEEWPQYDNASCADVRKKWVETSFHWRNPVSVDYNDDTCLPYHGTPCSSNGYPRYVVQASSVHDVQNAVTFAKKTGIRLVVKATGHDQVGRSSGADSLSVYTRELRGIEIVRKLESSAATKPSALVKIHAGERMTDVLAFASTNNLTVIGGADWHVGIGGWTLGGGHGPLTAKYGMGGDQTVEMDVVTADGEFLTVNEASQPDLFYALRGSGGSAYAVVISVTVQMYPPTAISEYLFAYNTTSDTDTLWSLAAYFHSELPRLSEAGLMGYYFVTPFVSTEKNTSMNGQVYGQLLAPGLSSAEVEKIVRPMEEHIKHADWADPVSVGAISAEHSDFTKWWATSAGAEKAGFTSRLGSRLLDRTALTSDRAKLKAALKTSTPPPWTLLGHFVAGPGTHSPPNGIPGGSNAVGRGWREAYTHIVLSRTWPTFNATVKKEVTDKLRNVWTKSLQEIAPDTGAYVNEVDPTEIDWRASLYGPKYNKLLKIKRKWDPTGVFWCKHCVGSELWEEIGPYGIENGVGQNHVQLCTR